LNFNDWAKAVFDAGKAKGWHSGEVEREPTRERVAVFLINLHGEVSEAWEAYRKGQLFSPCDKAEKMKAAGLPALGCLEEELADIVIRALDTAHTFGIDIQQAIETKHAFNATRPYRHGGKLT
jgi:NTP pyrophosphatase (non-canonical NTP hydrolase)